jgi:hypothetical protein
LKTTKEGLLVGPGALSMEEWMDSSVFLRELGGEVGFGPDVEVFEGTVRGQIREAEAKKVAPKVKKGGRKNEKAGKF